MRSTTERHRLLRVAPVLLASFAAAAACNLHISAGAEARDQWTRKYTLTRGATLEIRNTNGRITIQTIDGDVAEVVAERIVKAATDETAKSALAQFQITESVTPQAVVIDSTNRGMGFTINLSRTANFDVRVPRWANIKLDTTNGDIDVKGLGGVLRAEATNGRVVGSSLENGAIVETTNGTISLDFAALGEAGVSCDTTNGTITLKLPRDAKAALSARVTNGAIRTSDLDMQVIEQSRRRLDASIGGGGPAIKLETTNGAISIIGR